MITAKELAQRYKQAAKKLRDCAKLLEDRFQPTDSKGVPLSIEDLPEAPIANQPTACQLACDELAVAIIVKELACGSGPSTGA